MKDSSGSLFSPGWEGDYPVGVDCYWYVEQPPGQASKFAFSKEPFSYYYYYCIIDNKIMNLF